MIAVIADDFTGAAEIGGIGIRYGLNVVIETSVVQHVNVDLLVIATDTRSMSAMDASNVIRDITKKLLELNPDFIYKKIDSVLRGNVYDELVAQMEVMKLKKTVVVAANPVFKRYIKQGEYFIGNEPLHHTHFATDPDYPIRSCSVQQIIGYKKIPLITGSQPMDVLPKEGVVIGDVKDLDDLDNWCIQIDDKTMPAGASGFFNSFLRNKLTLPKETKEEVLEINNKALFVFGSSYPKDIDFESNIKSKGLYISYMPEEIYYNKNHDSEWFDGWVNDIIKGFKEHDKVTIAVPFRTSTEKNIGQRIKECFANIIFNVTQRVELNELLIEGGGTTSTILSLLGITKLIPVYEYEIGIIRMKVADFPNLYLTTKPGSYSWPEQVWNKQNIKIEKVKTEK